MSIKPSLGGLESPRWLAYNCRDGWPILAEIHIIIIYALLLYALFAYHPDDINNWSFWLFFLLVGYFVLGLYPSIIFYYYVIYYPIHGFKVGCEPLRGTLCVILCGYYAIKFYTKKEVWYKSRIQMQTDKKSLE